MLINKRLVMLFLLASIFIGHFTVSLAAPKGNSGDISECGVISDSGAYQVKQDLPGRGGLLPGGNCIEIAADSVVLDLGDHSITGQGSGAGVTDSALALSNLQVRNGTISGFASALDLSSSTGSVVEKVKAFSNSLDGIALGSHAVARFNVAIENGQGLVMTCPASAVGNSAWDNTSEDFVLYDEELCSSEDWLNSFGSSGGGGETCASFGLTECSQTCTNLNTDEDNCGKCGNQCGPGNLCISGSCTLSCQSGLTDCGGLCTNLITDEANCGGCGATCGSGEQCVDGQCTASCPTGQTYCTGACVDLSWDASNCGACGNACGNGQVCDDGSCRSATCLLDQECNDANACTADACDPLLGCSHTVTPGFACSDANACTINDLCSASGVCTGTFVNCDDQKSCTTDSCNASDGTCTNTVNPNSCLIGEVCYAAGDLNPLDNGVSCQPSIDQYGWTASPQCSDGELELCVRENVYGTCSGTRTCVLGSWGACSAEEPEQEICDGKDNDCDGTVDEDC